MQKKNILVLVIVLAVAAFVYMRTVQDVKQSEGRDAANNAGLPKQMMVGRNPIDPLCFAALGGEPVSFMPIKNCSEKYTEVESSAQLPGAGFLTATYTYKNSNPAERPSMVRYKYLGKTGNTMTVLVESNTGGTGFFSAIYRVARSKDTLQIKDTVAAGDRCNGGIESASIYEDRLIYNQFVTPFDFLVLADNNPFGLKSYEDLQNCASCCYGVARYNETDFRGISLIVDPENLLYEDDKMQKPAMQACFDKVLKSRMDIGQLDMPTEVVQSFVTEFHKTCTVKK